MKSRESAKSSSIRPAVWLSSLAILAMTLWFRPRSGLNSGRDAELSTPPNTQPLRIGPERVKSGRRPILSGVRSVSLAPTGASSPMVSETKQDADIDELGARLQQGDLKAAGELSNLWPLGVPSLTK